MNSPLILSLLLPLIFSPFISNPLGLLLLIFFSALSSLLMICFIFGTVYGLITFLIYVTGMLVLFSYMLSMFPNFAIELKSGVFWVSLLCVWFFSTLIFLESPFTEESLLTALIGGSNLSVFIFLVLALFFSLVVISALCFKSSSPLRSR